LILQYKASVPTKSPKLYPPKRNYSDIKTPAPTLSILGDEYLPPYLKLTDRAQDGTILGDEVGVEV
jgi:hypothetical protein